MKQPRLEDVRSNNNTVQGDIDMNSNQLESLGPPTLPNHAARKVDLDNLSFGLTLKSPVRVATTTALPAYTFASNVITVTANGVLPDQDGVAMSTGDDILVKDESGANDIYNGIYTVTDVGSGSTQAVLTRRDDFDDTASVVPNSYTWVREGTTHGDDMFLLTNNGPTITVNTDSIVFEKFPSVSSSSPEYGGLKIITSSPTVSFPSSPTKITSYDASSPSTSGVSLDAVNGTITITTAGVYQVEHHISAYINNNERELQAQVYINGVAASCKSNRHHGSGSLEPGNQGDSFPITLAVNDELDLRVNIVAGSASIILMVVSFSVHKIS